jgi:hypothetical protein
VLPTCGLPTGAAVTVTLALDKVRSHDMTTPAVAAAGVTPVLSFVTEPLTVTTDLPEATMDMTTGATVPPEVEANQVVTLTFNNQVPGFPPADGSANPCGALPPTGGHIHVAATIGGLAVNDLDVVVAPDPADPTKWTVSPPGTNDEGPGKWPPGAAVTITVDATATDYFAQPLGLPATASFKVKS